MLQRNFRFVSIFGFSMILMCSWETALGTSTIGLINGGTAGLIWMFFFAWLGFMAVNTSMAEMGSMAPTAGGQYHWVSEFAPRKHQKFLSYIIGWLCVLGWQTGAANTAFLAGTQIQGLLVLNYPDYVFERWHGTLLVFAVSAFSVLFNTFLAFTLPLVETVVLVVHLLGFFGILIPLWVLAPVKGNAHTVFTQFNNYGGWNSDGTSALVGILAAMIPLLGADAAVHMSEELRDASRNVARSMIWTTTINGLTGWVMLITFCFCLGNLDDAISTTTGYAFIEVFNNATGSKAGASAMSAIVIFITMFCNVSIVATSSRQLFAFARDQGVPLAKWVAYVPRKPAVPVNAILVSFFASCLLALINIGSTVAFNSIASLSLCAILASYVVSISCILLKRYRREPLLPSKFSLGRYGAPLNVVSLLFLVFVFVMSFFPSEVNPTPQWMNWSSLMFGSVCIFSLVYYYTTGRYHYVGPVEYVRKST